MREQIARLWNLRGAFRRVFHGPDGKLSDDGVVVISELRRFCYGAKPTIKLGLNGQVDPYASIAAAARQEVYQRVLQILESSDEDIARMQRIANQAEITDV
jgi:hypothetical protein